MEKVEAHVFLKVKTSEEAAEKILKTLRSIEGVVRANMVTGIYDMIVNVKSENLKTLGELIACKISNIENVISSITCIVVK
ncbi:MAG: Lrp/AsnC ligand binding domain-containing protein [Patescibacteria group bacterium]